MTREHQYNLTLQWTGNRGSGTSGYNTYDRSHSIKVKNKIEISGSSDPAFRGDDTKHNPEELLLASLSACHMLWYLHLCAEAGIIVLGYEDHATGIMIENSNGSGQFKEATLHPKVIVQEFSMKEKAHQIHQKANEFCFIAKSVKFPVYHKAKTSIMGEG